MSWQDGPGLCRAGQVKEGVVGKGQNVLWPRGMKLLVMFQTLWMVWAMDEKNGQKRVGLE